MGAGVASMMAAMSSLAILAAAAVALMVVVTGASGARATTATTVTAATTPHAPIELLDNLRKGHPRLLVLEDDIGRVSGEIQKNPTAAEYFREVRAAADKILDEPPVERKLIGPRLLQVSRQALSRITTLGAVYRLTGEARYGERARVEMLACAAFRDWNPSHFLDTAEMTAALGIGYDWFYGGLTDEERATIRGAIVEKGLKPGLHGYRTGVWWSKTDNNWAQVCAGGLTVGALAIADEEPQLAADVIDAARTAMAKPMEMFAPDGGFMEGPAYWGYATQYTAYYLAALQSALGTDFGFTKAAGFAQTGMFRIHTIGPSGETFNFADARSEQRPAPQMFWLARTFDRPAFAAHERSLEKVKHDALHLLWFDGRGDKGTIEALPKDAMFRRVEVACFRGAWNDPRAVYVAFKGGDNRANHGNLDLGSFVLDASGIRWAEELGPGDYGLPGYFGIQRWQYYKTAIAGQNTLVIN